MNALAAAGNGLAPFEPNSRKICRERIPEGQRADIDEIPLVVTHPAGAGEVSCAGYLSHRPDLSMVLPSQAGGLGRQRWGWRLDHDSGLRPIVAGLSVDGGGSTRMMPQSPDLIIGSRPMSYW
jgi:hypothetical protein